MFPYKDATLKAEKEEWVVPLKYVLDASITKKKRTVWEISVVSKMLHR